MHFFTGDRNNHLASGTSEDNTDNFNNLCCSNSANYRHHPRREDVCFNVAGRTIDYSHNAIYTINPSPFAFPLPLSLSPLSSPLLPLTLSYNSPIIPSNSISNPYPKPLS